MFLRLFYLLILIFVFEVYVYSGYVDDYISGRISLQSIIFEFTSKTRYSELYDLLTEILVKTNVYEVRFEKFRFGYSLGKDVWNDLYVLMEDKVFEKYVYNSVFSERGVLYYFSEYLVSKKDVSDEVIKNFARVCLLNNYLEELVKVILAKKVGDERLLFEVLVKLENFLMFSYITNIYYTFRESRKFDIGSMLIFSRALGECGDEESLGLLYIDNPLVVPLRVEFLARFGYFEEVVKEVSRYGISPKNAKYVFISFINLKDFESARLCLNYMTTWSVKNYFSRVLNVFTSKDLVKAEKELKELLLDDGIQEEFKNQIGFLVWVIETSPNLEILFEDAVSVLNYFNGIRSKRGYSKRVIDRINLLNSLN